MMKILGVVTARLLCESDRANQREPPDELALQEAFHGLNHYPELDVEELPRVSNAVRAEGFVNVLLQRMTIVDLPEPKDLERQR